MAEPTPAPVKKESESTAPKGSDAPYPGVPPYPPGPVVMRAAEDQTLEEIEAHLKVSEEFRLRAKVAEDIRPLSYAEKDALAEAQKKAEDEAVKAKLDELKKSGEKAEKPAVAAAKR